MSRTPKSLLAFLRSPAQWTMVLCTATVVVFLQVFGNWSFASDLFGQMYFFVNVFVGLCLVIGLGLAIHFAFDRLTDWLARSEDPRSKKRTAPPAALFPRH
jgi:hypothetical protein